MTERSFNDMLNEFLAYELLEAEQVKRNYVIQNVKKNNNWKGGTIPVPFYGSYASSLQFGSLTGETDIAEDDYVRGTLTGYKELWGTMLFKARDLAEHGAVDGQSSGMVSEQSFIDILPKTLNGFLDRMKQASSVNFLVGAHIATLTANGGATGEADVDHPERFTIGQKVIVDDADSAPVTGYVRTINMNTKRLIIYDARTGGAVVNLSAYTTAQSAKIYHPGADPASALGFTGIPQQLLSLANGGDAALLGQTKTDWPHLQATNVSGSGWTAATILDDIFDAWNTVQKLGRGPGKQDAVMDYHNMGLVLKRLQSTSGPFRYTKSTADLYGWTEISVIGVRGELSLVAVQEADTDKLMFLDWDSIKLFSNGLFMFQKDPEGKMYFTKRGANGYQYIVDAKMFGELVVDTPANCGIVHSIPTLS